MDIPPQVIAAGNWLLENTHRTLLAVTGGRFPHQMAGMQTLELITTGRKTGQRRGTLLTAPIYEDDRVVLVASKGGYPHNPMWYENLSVNPDVELIVEGATRTMRARTASAEEREELWPQLVKINGGYAGYQARAGREIPVVICEPR